MKPSTNTKIIIGTFIVLFCIAAFFLLNKNVSEKSDEDGFYKQDDIGKKILEER